MALTLNIIPISLCSMVFYTVMTLALLAAALAVTLFMIKQENPYKCHRPEHGWRMYKDEKACFIKMPDLKNYQDAKKS